MTSELAYRPEQQAEDPAPGLFGVVLDMAQAAKAGNVSGWLTAKYTAGHAEDLAYLTSKMLGVLIENNAIRRGIHPADAWKGLRERGIDEFG
ncbi:hypothetical protein [Rhodococcus chondri]|uniref:Uncharacterized protein n=1 Tax=Rhodococcus chondri TaxID=3065941 RepID=A0ABU7JWF9_9NOCA|nr:hypothetical protein [Rhodococcus sp. CC-R104]MEE2034351.1 hypothetical protein [Rhodococcus sp. CC-R104]